MIDFEREVDLIIESYSDEFKDFSAVSEISFSKRIKNYMDAAKNDYQEKSRNDYDIIDWALGKPTPYELEQRRERAEARKFREQEKRRPQPIIKRNHMDTIREIVKGGCSGDYNMIPIYWREAEKQMELLNKQPVHPTTPELRKKTLYKAMNILKSVFREIKSPEFHKAMKIVTPKQDEIDEWINSGDNVVTLAESDMRKLNDNEQLHFCNIRSFAILEANVRLKDSSFKIYEDDDKWFGYVFLEDRNF